MESTPSATRPVPPEPEGRPAQPRRHAPLPGKLTAEQINRLPLCAYQGPLHVVSRPEQVPAAVAALGREPLLGFDTEKRPSFRKGEYHAPALLQLAGATAVYIFQLRGLGGLPEGLAALLADARIVKAGVAVGRDLQELQALRPFAPQGFVDLGLWAKKRGVPHHGLRGLAAFLLGGRISKGAQLTNWERPELPRAALYYAATDAWVGRRLYEALTAQP